MDQNRMHNFLYQFFSSQNGCLLTLPPIQMCRLRRLDLESIQVACRPASTEKNIKFIVFLYRFIAIAVCFDNMCIKIVNLSLKNPPSINIFKSFGGRCPMVLTRALPLDPSHEELCFAHSAPAEIAVGAPFSFEVCSWCFHS